MAKQKGKNKRLKNIEIIINELHRTTPHGGSTVAELAALCGVSTRNIYRYLNDIESMGIEIIRPVQVKPGVSGKGRYRLKNIFADSAEDSSLITLISYCIVGELQCRHLFYKTCELLIKYWALKHGLSLPPNWTLKINSSSINEPVAQGKYNISHVNIIPFTTKQIISDFLDVTKRSSPLEKHSIPLNIGKSQS